MKKITAILTLACAIIFCDACINLQKLSEYRPAQVTLDQAGISNNDGKLEMDVTYSLSPEYFSRHTGVEFRPYIYSAAQDTLIPLCPAVIEGRDHEVFNQRMAKYEPHKADGICRRVRYNKNGGTDFSYTLKSNYEDWMDGACVYVDVIANAYTDTLHLETVPLYCDIYNIAAMVDRSPIEHYFYMVPRCNQDNLCLTTNIPFKVNSAVIDSEFYEGNFVENYKNIVFNCNVPSYKLDVVISNSPEATWAHNEKLAQSRMQAVISYFENVGVPYDTEHCTFIVKTENWDLIAEKLASSALPHAAEIINMIENGKDDSDALERQIRSKYPSEYNTIYKDYFPEARFAHIDLCPVLTDGRGLVYDYICDIDKSTTIHTLVEKPNEEVRGLNQQMLEYAEKEDYAAAASVADKILFKDANFFVNANRALVYFKNGRYEESKAIYENIEGKIPEADYNLGLLCLMSGEYAKADRLLSGYADYNTALTKLGAGKYAEAESILILLPESEYRNRALAISRKSQNIN